MDLGYDATPHDENADAHSELQVWVPQMQTPERGDA